MRRLVAVLTVALVLALSIPMAPGSSAAVAQGDQGLNGGWAIDDSGNVTFTHSLSSSLGAMQQAGAGWTRVSFRLGACYPNWTSIGCNGITALQAYDQVVNNILSHDLHVLAILTSESWPGTQTQWTANNAETAGGNGDNAFVQSFAQNAAAILAQHFAARVSSWEVWNEPNAWTSTDGQGHFSGGSYLYPSNYAWLLLRSYNAIKAAQPSSNVLFGGLFAHESFTAQAVAMIHGQHVIKRGDMPNARRPAPRGAETAFQAQVATCTSHEPSGADSGASYLCATYAVGLGYANWVASSFPFNDVGQHLYLGLGTTVSASTLTSYLNDLRQAYLLYEGPNTLKRTQVTEIGWPTDQVSPHVQSQNLQTSYQTLQAASYVARTYWFSTQDAPEAGLYYGIVDTNGAPKPAFTAYQQYGTFTAPPPVPTPTPGPTPTPVPIQPPVGTTPVQALNQTQRIVDTRTSGGAILSGSSRCFMVAGQGGIPPDAVGAVLNVTAVDYGTDGWVTVYPAGQSPPGTSTLNFDKSEYAIANNTIVGLGSGEVCVQVATVGGVPSSAQIIIDATGYLMNSGVVAMPMLAAPLRLADTRTSGGPIANGGTRCFTVAAVGAIPVNASAVILNVTAVGAGTDGWLSVYPASQPIPATSTVNFTAADYAIANTTIMRVHSDQVCVSVGTVDSVPGGEDVILDATGYLTDTALAQMPMLQSPQRAVDTRTTGGPIPTGTTRCFTLSGQAGIPTSATAAMVNLTAVGVGNGWLGLFAAGQSAPATSTLNFDTVRYAIANNAVARLGTAGQLCVDVGTVNTLPGNAQVIMDVTGYLLP